MSLLAKEIRECLSQWAEGPQGRLSCTFIFPPEFTGFHGHFPGQPILPGVCMVQAVIVMLGEWKRMRVSLRRIESAKWFTPVRPGAELQFVVAVQNDDAGALTVRAKVASGEQKVADLIVSAVCVPLVEKGAA